MLNITTKLTTPEGIEVSNAIGRVGAADNIYGKYVSAVVEIFKDQASYEAGFAPLSVLVFDAEGKLTEKRLINSISIEYNRTVDGTDILEIAHNELIKYLAGQGIFATKSL